MAKTKVSLNKVCAVCGKAAYNKYGICRCNDACRRAYQRAANSCHAGKSIQESIAEALAYVPRPEPEPRELCGNCGKPAFTSKGYMYGYCKRTKECESLRARVIYGDGHRAYRVPCTICGSFMSLGQWCRKTEECRKEAQRIIARANSVRVKSEVMQEYGNGMCACCGEDNLYFLAIDHIYGDGARERGTRDKWAGGNLYGRLRSAGFPGKDRYQVLCHNCNSAKGTKAACPCNGGRNRPRAQLTGQLTLF